MASVRNAIHPAVNPSDWGIKHNFERLCPLTVTTGYADFISQSINCMKGSVRGGTPRAPRIALRHFAYCGIWPVLRFAAWRHH
jgi:hypothetical protein